MKAINIAAVATVSPLKSSQDSQLPKPASRGSAPHRQTRVLSVSPFADDHAALRQILAEMRMPFGFATAATRQEAAARLSLEQFGIILCECSLPDGTWRDILNQICGAAEPPFLIVTSRLADEWLWAEALNLGAYDVLAKPFRDQEVQHVLSYAWVKKGDPVPQREDPIPRTRTAGAA